MKHNYTIDFFLHDPEFIRWVKNPDDGSTQFWNSFVEKHPESKSQMLKAIELIRTLNIMRESPTEAFKREILNDIVSSISVPNNKKIEKNRRHFINALWRYAAALLITAGTIYAVIQLLPTGNFQTVDNGSKSNNFIKEAPLGAKIRTKLPDGSMVWINSGSQLKYFDDTLTNTRNVQLSGEAFFEVVKNPLKPFIVRTQSISVEALGTSFNVREYKAGKDPEVALLTGKVAVTKLEGHDALMELLPGEKAVISSRDLTRENFDYIQDIGWKEGILAFKDAGFDHVKKELERWYGVEIKTLDEDAFEGWHVEGRFENQSLERVLTHLSYAKGFNFEIDGKEVLLTSK